MWKKKTKMPQNIFQFGSRNRFLSGVSTITPQPVKAKGSKRSKPERTAVVYTSEPRTASNRIPLYADFTLSSQFSSV